MKNSKWLKILLWTIGILVLISLANENFSIVLLIGGALLVLYGFKGKPATKDRNTNTLPNLSKKREQRYLESGMYSLK